MFYFEDIFHVGPAEILSSYPAQKLRCTLGTHVLDYNDGPGDVFLLHPFAVGPDGTDAHLGFLWEEHKHLVSGIVIVSHQDDQIGASRSPLTRLVTERHLELVKCLVQLVLSNLLVQ